VYQGGGGAALQAPPASHGDSMGWGAGAESLCAK